MPRQQQAWKVGELARRTGLTVRALHHYDRIGLLSPSGRTDSIHGAGHRLYTAADVARLQQILSLKMLGFGLERVREYLSRGDYDPRQVVRLHLERVRGQADELRRLAQRLAALADALDKAEVVSADEFLDTIEVMTMIEKYYTPEQLAQIEARNSALGEKRIKELNAEWPKLFAAVRAEMDFGTDPANSKVQALARKWYGLLDEFTGGDPGLFNSTRNMYANEDQIREMDVKAMRPMFEYIRKAAAAAGINLPGR
jgi:DNA-binding transcriptional MerR regulator